MMKKINEILKQYSLKPYRYTKEGKVMMIETNNGKYTIKERSSNNQKIYDYLNSRNFDYYPKIINNISDDYEITEYIDEIDLPLEQKMIDLIDLTSLLHSKTTHYQQVDEDSYKEIYEDISNNITYLNSYYNDLIAIIDRKVYMSPSEYLLARNISKIFSALNYCYDELQGWYNLVKNMHKKRLVVIHNNLDLSHFLRNNNSYLISWDKSKIDIPVFDLYKLYKHNGLQFEFYELLKRYEKKYPLLPEERKILFILMALPDKIEFSNNEYNNCIEVDRMVEFIYKTETIISPYYSKKGESNQCEKK